MTQLSSAGWVYALSHPAWRVGPERQPFLKIGKTARHPDRRRAEICSVSGLLAPARLEWCVWVEDRHAAERALHERFAHRRLRKGRELFLVTVDEVRATAETAAPVATAPCRSSYVGWVAALVIAAAAVVAAAWIGSWG